ncbi:hypothetical protein RSSM_06864 [Rhodopirellula sallentina SM41]|uniref:Uncharacterized protein n=1 Tax=Rhodopirellula sallentina SM41 TaxID=1263870 RepID=M5TRC5_9BACT|nr:hypothetical protein RSSM_06864 [Rhodopirellula sallentina SM41]
MWKPRQSNATDASVTKNVVGLTEDGGKSASIRSRRLGVSDVRCLELEEFVAGSRLRRCNMVFRLS